MARRKSVAELREAARRMLEERNHKQETADTGNTDATPHTGLAEQYDSQIIHRRGNRGAKRKGESNGAIYSYQTERSYIDSQ